MTSPLSSVMSYFTSFRPGARLVEGGELQLLAQLRHGAVSGIVAKAGGTQAAATVLTGAINEVATVASSSDSVMLPLAIPGTIIRVVNSGSNSMQVFGQVSNPQNANAGDTIIPNNSSTPAATGTGVAQAANADAIYTCYKVGVWKQLVSG